MITCSKLCISLQSIEEIPSFLRQRIRRFEVLSRFPLIVQEDLFLESMAVCILLYPFQACVSQSIGR